MEILSPAESVGVRQQIHRSRLIRLRFVYRDKNASVRTPLNDVPLKAKARLCAQASREPLALDGMLKLDSPAVHRLGIMVFLQVPANLGWTAGWFKGDITAAFLQGRPRDVETLGEL